jgi:hypothetical protein
MLLCNIEAAAESNSPKNWHVTCSQIAVKLLLKSWKTRLESPENEKTGR